MPDVIVPCSLRYLAKENMKKIIDLNTLSETEKNSYLKDTWCSKCQLADLGITNAQIYIEANHKYIRGCCRVCGENCLSKIIEIIADVK